MDFYAILDQVVDLLRQRQRVTYRALQRQFQLDDAFLEDVKVELIKGQRLAVDEGGEVLVWIGDAGTAPVPISVPAEPPGRTPLTYTPPYLVEKILTSRSALEGERKQVTVLFVDVSGFTSLSERLDPEDVHSLMNRAFELMLAEVHRYEGTVNQFLGDGIMALFGAPIAHEDHAQRAVHAAWGSARPWRAIRLNSRAGRGSASRCGRASTLVSWWWGALGTICAWTTRRWGTRRTWRRVFRQAADPGRILIAEATHRLAAGYFHTRSLGDLALKGKAEPVGAWEVISARIARTRLEVEAERGLTPFVGRERELQLLFECFEQARQATGKSSLSLASRGSASPASSSSFAVGSATRRPGSKGARCRSGAPWRFTP